MPITRSGAIYNPSISPQKGHRREYGRRQSVTEGKGSRAETATKSLSGHIKSQLEGLQQCIAAQRVLDPCRSVEKMHEFLPDCEKIPGTSQHLQVTQWMASIDGKEKHNAFNSRIEENNPSPAKQVPKTAPVARRSNSNVKKQPQAQNKGKGKAPATRTLHPALQNPKDSAGKMARTMMELQKKEDTRLKYQK
ncbi:hypothetical protein O181_113868 [Austropuccinia psidii MF-1]|uniref:Uncharacterized protein n=1 Tax=Austropuccinia psidii MF-1 TaxID=1389203 RepID=A0A9Q3K3T0_9BASI|nr:hypothetical protein [Austropuccinia psidii MF-1]